MPPSLTTVVGVALLRKTRSSLPGGTPRLIRTDSSTYVVSKRPGDNVESGQGMSMAVSLGTRSSRPAPTLDARSGPGSSTRRTCCSSMRSRAGAYRAAAALMAPSTTARWSSVSVKSEPSRPASRSFSPGGMKAPSPSGHAVIVTQLRTRLAATSISCRTRRDASGEPSRRGERDGRPAGSAASVSSRFASRLTAFVVNKRSQLPSTASRSFGKRGATFDCSSCSISATTALRPLAPDV
mmetsp:Transcript_7485/g.23639  ORF Transcript_7485/g.23639 Transcript_7485/m.23639 type:complete len:239 (-) Transcript_7485:193-909(-)